MRLNITIILVMLFSELNAQQNIDYTPVDVAMMQIPDSLTYSTNRIANYINSKFSNSSDKSRAAFIWIAQNIGYDVENMYAINQHQSATEFVDQALATRKGICIHYANLFADIMDKLGIKTYVVSGYTKQRGFVEYIPHAWCAALIDSQWLLFDPTWGSGCVRRSKFRKEVNNSYYKASPEQLIKTHMPFDPLWQFLNYPVTSDEFYKGKISSNKSKPYFNYMDTLKRYEQESDIDRLISSNSRIERNGVKNSLTFDKLHNNKQEVENCRNKILFEKYNAAVNLYNEGINYLNKFIEYRNKKFTPIKSDREIKQMVTTPDSIFVLALSQLEKIKNTDSIIGTAIAQLNASIEAAISNLNEEKIFLDIYFKTEEENRAGLFYKYH